MLAASTDADEEMRMMPWVERIAKTEMHGAAAARKASGIEQFAEKTCCPPAEEDQIPPQNTAPDRRARIWSARGFCGGPGLQRRKTRVLVLL